METLLAGGIPIAILVASWFGYRAYRRRAPRPWCELLGRLALRHQHLSGLADLPRRRVPRQVDLPHGDALVRMALTDHSYSESELLVVTLSARWPVPAGPELRVLEEGLLESVLKEWGAMEDVTVGHKEFDARFVVHARDEQAMRAAFSPRAQQIMLERQPRLVRSDGTTVFLDATSYDRLPEDRFNELVELLAGLVSADLFGVGALRALPGAVYYPPSGPFESRTPPLVELEAAGTQQRVCFEPAAITELVARPVTRASIDGTVETPPWSVGVRASGELDGPAEGLPLPTGLHNHLWGVGAGTLAQQGRRVSFTWSAVETDPERLLACRELLALFARPVTRGAYR